MLKFNVKTFLAGIVLVVLGLATPAAQAGILVTDGRNIDPGATGEDDTAKARRAEAEARHTDENTDEGDGTEELSPPATKMTPREAEIYLLAAAIINSPVVHVEDDTTPDPEALTTVNSVVASLGDAEGGCAATPVGGLGGLAVAGLLWRRRKRR